MRVAKQDDLHGNRRPVATVCDERLLVLLAVGGCEATVVQVAKGYPA